MELGRNSRGGLGGGWPDSRDSRYSMPISTPVPVDLDVCLRDGSTARLRALVPDDVAAVVDLYRRLSIESAYNRFNSFRVPDVSFAQTSCATGDHQRFGLVAEREGRIVAVADYVRDPAAPQRAEVAFTVADDFHGQGLGTKMLEQLAVVARGEGISEFEAYTRTANEPMLRVFADSGFAFHGDYDAGVARVTLALGDTAAHDQRAQTRAGATAAASIGAFFAPRSVAVVGVSRRRGRIGSETFHNLLRAGFRGPVYPVSATGEPIAEVPGYRTVSEIPEHVDLAIIAVPGDRVEAVVDDCIAKHVKAIVVISAGFAEAGAEGQAREAALLAKVRAAGIRMVGPNCMGVINTDPEVRLNATFAPSFPRAGRVAFSSQSGALGLAILEHLEQLNLGLSTFVSVGNKADVSSNDLIQYWAEDARTDVILLYLESFGNPRKFSHLARRVAKTKPIIAVKAGRSTAGARAASSHTGALASGDLVVDALFRQSGVIRTDTLEEMFDVAALVANQPIPSGRRVAILTNAGGPAILAADACEAAGLQVPRLSEDTLDALRAFLPAAAGLSNPVDMLATASADDYRRAIPLMLADPAIDTLIAIFIPPLVTAPADVARAIADSVGQNAKPVVATFLGTRGTPDMLAPVPCYAFPESAARAIAHVVEYAEWRARPSGTPVEFCDAQRDQARAIIDRCLATGSGWMPLLDADALLATYGISTADTRVAGTAEEAVTAAGQLGYPVVMKAAGPGVLHKTEAGGVVLDLRDEASVRTAHRDLTARLGPDAASVSLQRMVRGVEMLIGVTLDPIFGHVLLCGSGGTLVELMQDTVCRLHPLTDVSVVEMVSEIRGAARLLGYRGAAPTDAAALRDMLLRVSALVSACPEILEMDLNPVMVLQKGACAVDVRIRLGAEAPPARYRDVTY
jgi:acetate---CoA ligase (ADP-forming)